MRVAALGSLIWLTTLAAASGQHGTGTPPFRSGASLVALNVTVTDSHQQFVIGLRPDDFAIYEDGVRQELSFFEADSVPIDLILLIDTSASMTPHMPLVRQAAIGFVRTLRPGDRGAVVQFDSRVQILHDLSGDVQSLKDAVRATSAAGGTSLHNAIYIALRQFGRPAQSEQEVRRQAIVVLSDGDDTTSLISFDDVMELAHRKGVAIYTIGVQEDVPAPPYGRGLGRNPRPQSSFKLNRLARETGARAFFPTGVADLDGIYGAIAAELSNQYSLAYAPANQHQDGGFRRIIVQLPGWPELRPRARNGYLAEAPAPSRSFLRGQDD